MIDFIQNYFANITILQVCVLIGTIAGLFVMVFQVTQSIALWYFNIISATLLGINFYANEIYAYAFFQVYYVVTSVYGIYSWTKGKTSDGEKMPIQKLTSNQWGIVGLCIVAFTIALFFLLQRTGSSVAIVDAIITTLSIIATFLLTKKFLDYWYFWIVADSLYILTIVYFQQEDLYPTIILYAGYILTAIFGIYKWRKEYSGYKLKL